MSDDLRAEKAALVKVLSEIAAKHAVDKVGPKAGRGKASSMEA